MAKRNRGTNYQWLEEGNNQHQLLAKMLPNYIINIISLCLSFLKCVHGQALALEAAGTRVLLRDKRDELVLLCNDGDYYCSK